MARRNKPGKKSELVVSIETPTSLGRGLSLKQSQFLAVMVEQLLGEKPVPINPVKAAIDIGVPKDQAKWWAKLMMEHPAVKEALNRQIVAQIESSQATPRVWLAEVAKLALQEPPTIKDFYREDGSVKPPSEWTESMASEVVEVTSEELFSGYGKERKKIGYTKKVKLHSRKNIKVQALEMLAKYHKLIVQTLEILGPGIQVTERKVVDLEEIFTRIKDKDDLERLREILSRAASQEQPGSCDDGTGSGRTGSGSKLPRSFH